MVQGAMIYEYCLDTHICESNFGKPAAAVKTKGEPLKYAQSIIIIEANNHYL